MLWLLGIPIAQWWSAARTFRTTPAARGERSYIFDDQRIEISGGLTSGTLSWPAIVRVVETRELFLLFLSAQLAHFIPKAAFSSPTDMAEFRALAARKAPTSKQGVAGLPDAAT